MNRVVTLTILSLLLITLSASARAENVKCDAKYMDPVSNAPINGFIVALTMSDQTITLTTKDNTNIAYQIDFTASKIAERTYVAKIGDQPIAQTPTDKQISVMMVKPGDTDKKFDGALTDNKLDSYILLNCKPIIPTKPSTL